METTKTTIITALKDKNLLGMFLDDIETWRSWFAFLKAFFALEADVETMSIYQKCTGRKQWPSKPSNEAWVISGRRSGKSFITSLIACYVAVFVKHELSHGETGYVLIISPTRQQGGIIKKYLSSFFNDNPFLSSLLARETSSEIELSNSITIMVLSSDFRSIRGFTSVCAIVDEIAFFFSEGSRPDHETIRALRPALATTNGPLIAISSPYAKRGSLYTAYKNHYGKDSPTLVWQSSSTQMNPTLSSELIARAKDEDPEGSQAEWEGRFRSDIESFISREALEACVVQGRFEIPYISENNYFGFCDPSGGSRDSMTLAISHLENEVRILDLIREVKPPFSPDAVVKNFAETLKEYSLSEVTGDRYGGEWPRERFQEHGINYQTADKTKSDLYKEFLPLINSGRIELLDNSKLISQIVNLERRTGRGGKDSIDHSPNAFDDLANCVAGALVSLQDYGDIEIAGFGETLSGQYEGII